MLNMIVIGLVGVLAIGMAAYNNIQSFSNEITKSYLYTDLAVAALDDLYKTGKLSQEDFIAMRKEYTEKAG
jgi:hypothetical protein